MRAMADNPDLARLSGIDTERVVIWTWIIAGVLAAAAGIFLGMDTRLNPIMGWKLLLPVFAAAILGGIGSPYGAIVGALIIGIAQEMSTLVIAPAYKPAVAFALMVAMLIWRPTGLFAGGRCCDLAPPSRDSDSVHWRAADAWCRSAVSRRNTRRAARRP
ncbi:MAG: branched-chain amino acid ABC transporter permease [Halofilum sp. (in: g-proteobacteria)]|nr:branched-chain amino acid ABC transporter permease [Halofilum sp. (in: g-proteobacteria)]